MPRVMLFPMKQSTYRQGNSTETAVIRVLNDVIHATVEGKVTALVLLDLSSACLLYTSPSPRDGLLSRMPSSA